MNRVVFRNILATRSVNGFTQPSGTMLAKPFRPDSSVVSGLPLKAGPKMSSETVRREKSGPSSGLCPPQTSP